MIAAMDNPQPTGHCWCGCGNEPKSEAFFLPGHDRAAEAAVVTLIYGSIPKFLAEHGFGPEARSAIKELAELRRSELQ
jgi:hypothetical protein